MKLPFCATLISVTAIAVSGLLPQSAHAQVRTIDLGQQRVGDLSIGIVAASDGNVRLHMMQRSPPQILILPMEAAWARVFLGDADSSLAAKPRIGRGESVELPAVVAIATDGSMLIMRRILGADPGLFLGASDKLKIESIATKVSMTELRAFLCLLSRGEDIAFRMHDLPDSSARGGPIRAGCQR
jgi:hypothetical protein